MVSVIRSDISLTEIPAENGRIRADPPVGQAGFAACEAAINTDTGHQMKCRGPVARNSRLIGSRRDPDLIAALGHAQCRLQIGEGICPGSAIGAPCRIGLDIKDPTAGRGGPVHQDGDRSRVAEQDAITVAIGEMIRAIKAVARV